MLREGFICQENIHKKGDINKNLKEVRELSMQESEEGILRG